MLDHFSLRGDESFTVLFVLKPFAQMWNEIRTVEPNPPLMYLLLRGWIALAGASEFATRFFSVSWGVLCVPLIYRLALSLAPSPGPRLPAPLYSSALRGSATNEGEGRGGQWKKRDSFEGSKDRRRGNVMALTAALLVTINPYQIWHSQDVRNYAMWPALSLLAILFFWLWTHPHHVPDRTPPLLILGGFILAELAALYTHYYEAFILIALNLYALIFFVRRRAWSGWKSASLLQWVGAQMILAFLYLPFPLILSNRVASYGEGSGQQGVALWDIWQRTFSVFTLGETIDESVRRFLWIPFALALVVILIARWRHERRGVFLLLYAGVPTLAVFLLNLVRPLFLERYLNGIAPAYYLLFAWGISALAVSPYASWVRRGVTSFTLAGFVMLALMALANYFYNPVYAKSPDWRALARAIDAESRKGDVILQNFQETSLVYYDRSGLPLVVYPLNYLPDAQTTRALDSLNGKFQRIWFVPSSNQVPGTLINTWRGGSIATTICWPKRVLRVSD